MIIDNIKNAHLYYSVHKRFEKAFDFLKKLDTDKCSEGTFEVDGSRIKAIIDTKELKNKKDALLETHQKYIDIHIPLSKKETFGWESTKVLDRSLNKYDSENDIEFFNYSSNNYFS